MSSDSDWDSVPVQESSSGGADDWNAIPTNDAKAPSQPKTWGEAFVQGFKNIPSSAYDFGSNIIGAVRHPITTVGNTWDAAAGGLRNALPSSISSAIDSADWNPAATQRATNTANAVGALYKNRYGSEQAIKNTIASDPMGVASDASTVLGGAGVAANALKLGKVGEALGTASKLTNPLSLVAPTGTQLGKAADVVGSNLLGLTTGTGADTVRTAFLSGMNGKTAFWNHLTGGASFNDVLDSAKAGLQNMTSAKQAEYRSGMVDIANDKNVLSFDDIDKAIQNSVDTVTYKGQIKNEAAANVAGKISNVVNDWKNLDPAEYHTPEGLDALKQKVGAIQESIPYEDKTSRLVAGKVYNAIKGTISDQAPTYAGVMKNYSDASDQISEIQRALSLKDTASADTAIRKLQSLTRNNASTNYGFRLDLAKQLEGGGGVDILPALAGQSMNTWTPRGLAGQLGSLGTLGASYLANPWSLGALPFESPKLVGAAAYGAGKATNVAKKLGANQSGLNNSANVLNQLGRINGAASPEQLPAQSQ